MRLVTAFACAMMLICLGVAPSHAEKRVALVIGNSSYRNVPALLNTQNDANDIAASFKRLGFSVNKVTDGTFDDMRRAMLQFGRDAREAELAVVFFAGHGMEVGGENWLIPTDAELQSDRDAENEAIPLRSAMLQVANASSLGLVILDSCRNNPFAAKMQRASRYRAVDRGLARVEPTDNVLVAYAAKDGTTARDGAGRNSPFTAALLRHLELPGLEVQFLFRDVRDDVMAATNHEQQPFVYGSLSRQTIYLKAGAADSDRPASSAATPGPGEAERAWAFVKDSKNAAVLEEYIRRFGDSFYGVLARATLGELKKNQVAVVSPPNAPLSAQPSPAAPAANPPAAAKPPSAATAAKPPAAAPTSQAALPAQGQQLQLLYSPWTKFCATGQEANAKQVCLTGKDGRVETGQPVVAAVLIQPEGGPNVLRVTLPLTVQLQRGTRVMVDQTKLATMTSDTQSTPYTICFINGCMADYDATPDVVKQLKKGQSLWVQGFSISGEFINLPIPLEEFGKTLDGPPTDPKVVEEQQKKMQDQLQKRAEAVKKQLESQQASQPGK